MLEYLNECNFLLSDALVNADLIFDVRMRFIQSNGPQVMNIKDLYLIA